MCAPRYPSAFKGLLRPCGRPQSTENPVRCDLPTDLLRCDFRFHLFLEKGITVTGYHPPLEGKMDVRPQVPIRLQRPPPPLRPPSEYRESCALRPPNRSVAL